ncbi:carboxypeptidase-like regulatory domain-containing protein [Chloroflexota bacterium]
MRKFLFLVITSVLATLLVVAGTSCAGTPTANGGIEGTITDLDGKPVAGMRVGIVSGTTGFPEIAPETNDEGYYQIGSVPPGTFEVAVHDREGNRIGLGSVVVRSGKTSTLNFTISTGEINDDQAKAAIYAAVVRQLYTVDHTFGEPPNFPIIYLVGSTDDSVGDPDAPQTKSNVLLSSVQEAVTVSLEDLPAEFVWVGNFNEVPLDSNTGVVEGNGAIITLGNVHFQEDGSALVSASIYIANLAAGGLTYIVEHIDSAWIVVGNTGVLWMA